MDGTAITPSRCITIVIYLLASKREALACQGVRLAGRCRPGCPGQTSLRHINSSLQVYKFRDKACRY